mmetsp:Transcript_99268/g.269769  ORF Transcript_99268/g.269769 Transcript_99268/m.269769 type:complete len:1137 (-) Transcript_99268:86-3496(-)
MLQCTRGALLAACLPAALLAGRIRVDDSLRPAAARGGGAACCCTRGPCGEKERTTGKGVYHPDQNKCCKLKDGGCPGTFSTSRFKEESGAEMCSAEQGGARELPGWQLPGAPPAVDLSALEEGSHAHTLHTHCQQREEDAEAETAAVSHAVGAMAQELAANNIHSMTQGLFTMYACIRWAPDVSFWPLARDELASDQLPASSGSADGDPVLLMARAVERGHFIPLRCSENVGVYDKKDSEGSVYPTFEARLGGMADFFAEEVGKAFDSRAKVVEANQPFDGFWTSKETKRQRWYDLLNETKLFNGAAVARRTEECRSVSDRLLELDVHGASAEQLWGNCGFVKWWAPKLQTYLQRFPFQAFLAGKTGGQVPPGQRVLFCFGKRVSGELHRRTDGSHILTDMNGVGCHGFWDYQKAGAMLERIVKLWAPPTCQLTELELKMKTRTLEMFDEMNKRMFEAMPAIIASEQFSVANPSAEEAAGASGLLAGGKWVFNKMSALFNTYQSLARIMSGSVMKWSVCPVGNATGLDRKLGSDDLVVQKYTQEAYAQWGGKNRTLPGEDCAATTALGGPGDQRCAIGTVRSDYPERYKGVSFACPALPPLPAAAQLTVLKDAHATKCFLRATQAQLGGDGWHYMGLRPTEVQHQAREHGPTEQMELVTVVQRRSSLDELGISRDWVTLGRACTYEVRKKYSRWCSKPAVLNAATLGSGLADSLAGAADSLAGLAGSGGNNDRYGWGSWLHRTILGAGTSLGSALHGAAANAVQGLSAKVQNRRARIEKARLYPSIEAGEALWGMAFQTAEGGGGSREQFGRWVLTVPCDGVDVEEEIESEFAWGEVALEVLGRARKADPSKTVPHPLTLSVRTEIELQSGAHMRRETHVAWRRGAAGWTRSRSSSLVYVRRLFEVAAPSYSSTMPEAYGAEMKYTCGPRGSIYGGQASGSDFAACVRGGAEQARVRDKASGKDEAELKRLQAEIDKLKRELEPLQDAADNADENSVEEAQAKADETARSLQITENKLAELLSGRPLTLKEYDDEIVVRVDFQPLPHCEFSPGSLREISNPAAGENATYSENANARAAAAMIRRGQACTTVDTLHGDTFLFDNYVAGSYTGAETPKNTRREVILSPVDVLAWLGDP